MYQKMTLIAAMASSILSVQALSDARADYSGGTLNVSVTYDEENIGGNVLFLEHISPAIANSYFTVSSGTLFAPFTYETVSDHLVLHDIYNDGSVDLGPIHDSSILTFNIDGGQHSGFINMPTDSINISSGELITISTASVEALASANDFVFIANDVNTTSYGLDLLEPVDNSLWEFSLAHDNGHEIYVQVTTRTLTERLSPNNAAVIKAVSSIIDNYVLFDSLYMETDAASLANLIESTQPTIDGGYIFEAVAVSNRSLSVTHDRLAALRQTRGINAGDQAASLQTWGKVFGQTAEQDARDQIDGYELDSYGFTVGVDKQDVLPGTTLGVALTYAKTEIESENANRTSTDVDSYQLSVYGDYQWGNKVTMAGILGYGYGENETVRHNVLGLSGNDALADFASHQWVAQAELSRGYAVGDTLTLTPNALAHYVHYDSDSYTETGSSLNVSSDVDALQIFELGVGLDADWQFSQQNGGVISPNLHASYRYDLIGDEVEATSRFTAGGLSFTTKGFEPAQHTFNAGSKLSYQSAHNWTIELGYDFAYKSDYQSHNGMLQVGYRF